MTDRELLELAAKAAGVEAYWSSTLDEWQKDITEPYVGGKPWNPLDDDGDAMRLLVKLRLPLDYSSHSWGELDPATTCGRYWESGEGRYLPFRVRHNGDPYTAARRAIVRAAAEIGKGNK